MPSFLLASSYCHPIRRRYIVDSSRLARELLCTEHTGEDGAGKDSPPG